MTADDLMEDKPIQDEVVELYDILYFDGTQESEIATIRANISKTYPESTIEDASDEIHGSRICVKIAKVSAITYLKNILLWDCEGRSLHFQHALRAGRPWTDRVIEALRLARAERPDLFDKEK